MKKIQKEIKEEIMEILESGQKLGLDKYMDEIKVLICKRIDYYFRKLKKESK